MTPARLPLLEQILESGADDRVFDGLLVVGPAVIALIAAFGRSPATIALAAGYIVAFLSHTCAKAVR
ncbi:hypothetical protein SAMN04488065_0328 [Haloplanus vescus]|uniref:Uncharacterized protein n=1 Tax=Haloplanus vescus TaxID=555874 RepID=A0A1H3VY48_9EURY|nr:hypothetical protein [Haloplanus vescus]SDZ78978.1 hypothetical protein SAMN04488065_0328 [Haloplanus vescus]